MFDMTLKQQCNRDVKKSTQPDCTTPRGTAEGNRVRKFMVGDKDRKIAYQLLSEVKHTLLGKINLLPIRIDLGSKKRTDRLQSKSFPPWLKLAASTTGQPQSLLRDP